MHEKVHHRKHKSIARTSRTHVSDASNAAHIERKTLESNETARESTETTPSRVSRGLEMQPNIIQYIVYTYRGVLTTTHVVEARLPAVVGII